MEGRRNLGPRGSFEGKEREDQSVTNHNAYIQRSSSNLWYDQGCGRIQLQQNNNHQFSEYVLLVDKSRTETEGPRQVTCEIVTW